MTSMMIPIFIFRRRKPEEFSISYPVLGSDLALDEDFLEIIRQGELGDLQARSPEPWIDDDGRQRAGSPRCGLRRLRRREQ